jgi:alkyl hydroperoxide reductase subunit AhpC
MFKFHSNNYLAIETLLTTDSFTFPNGFIIDKEGIIQYYSVNKLLWNQLLRILQSFQYIRENLSSTCHIN